MLSLLSAKSLSGAVKEPCAPKAKVRLRKGVSFAVTSFGSSDDTAYHRVEKQHHIFIII